MKHNSPNILISTGIYPPHIGGIAYYAAHLQSAFRKQGITTFVVTYTIEHSLPFGIRHLVYFLKLVFTVPRTDYILALDTISTGFPAVCASILFRKKIIIRVGGDFLWESYINRTKDTILLSRFYKTLPKLSLKEKIIFRLIRFLFRHAYRVVFSTDWQKDILLSPYTLSPERTEVIENYYHPHEVDTPASRKNFIWAGRDIPLKNVERLRQAFTEAQKKIPGIELELFTQENALSQGQLLDKIKTSYAVILPSISDVSPNIILESIRFGKPFIMTNETGFRRKLDDLGLFVDPLSIKDITEKILSLSDEKVYIKYQGNIDKFSYRHSWEKIAREFLTIFETK